jgi:uncharacterized membrane protein
MSTAQQMADWIAEFSGTITFFSLNALVFLIWITTNTLLPRPLHFDAYPFQFLTMAVSLEAIFLSIFVLISQNHQSKKDRITAELDYQTDVYNGQVLEEMNHQMGLLAEYMEKTWHRIESIEQKSDHLLTMYNRRRKYDDRRGTTTNDSAGAGQSLETTSEPAVTYTDDPEYGRTRTDPETASSTETTSTATGGITNYAIAVNDGYPTSTHHTL